MEGILQSRVIDEAIHLRKFDVDANLTVKGDKLPHQYNTRANQMKKIDHQEKENRELGKEVTTLRENYERLSPMMETLVAAQNQPTPTPQTPLQRIVISEIVSMPVSMAPVNASHHHMPLSFPWGMPHNFVPEGYQLDVEVPMDQPVIFIPPLVVHDTPYVKEPIFHADQSETVGVYERMNEFQDRFQAMQKEIQALRGKELFGKNAHDLLLVHNVKIPHKFKVPDFEKFRLLKARCFTQVPEHELVEMAAGDLDYSKRKKLDTQYLRDMAQLADRFDISNA
ncbi:uncharacterized protein LOC127102938 [Lathyrus oleraceus]|uniref:uncharacterized protein LOC127102938 n=1 Tax=Pisum sativum TaxID=3888 RepID=UPI0021CF5FB9|nr:uncharacterized protein LOC127102938 [Pisum sativum]